MESLETNLVVGRVNKNHPHRLASDVNFILAGFKVLHLSIVDSTWNSFAFTLQKVDKEVNVKRSRLLLYSITHKNNLYRIPSI